MRQAFHGMIHNFKERKISCLRFEIYAALNINVLVYDPVQSGSFVPAFERNIVAPSYKVRSVCRTENALRLHDHCQLMLLRKSWVILYLTHL